MRPPARLLTDPEPWVIVQFSMMAADCLLPQVDAGSGVAALQAPNAANARSVTDMQTIQRRVCDMRCSYAEEAPHAIMISRASGDSLLPGGQRRSLHTAQLGRRRRTAPGAAAAGRVVSSRHRGPPLPCRLLHNDAALQRLERAQVCDASVSVVGDRPRLAVSDHWDNGGQVEAPQRVVVRERIVCLRDVVL